MQKGGFYNQYNVGTGGGISVKQLVNKYLEVNSIRNKVVEFAPRRLGDIDNIYASGDKIKKDMDFECIIPLEHSLESSYRWHKYLVSNKLMG